METTFTLIEKTAFLKGVDVLASVPTEALAELAARAKEVHCDPGEVLYREGDVYRGAYLVVQGTLELRAGRALIRVLGPGMSIGELWLGPGESHSYTLMAMEHSHLLHVPHEDMMDSMHDLPEIGVALVQTFARRVHEINGRVLELENLVGRLYATLSAAGIEAPDPRRPEGTAAEAEATGTVEAGERDASGAHASARSRGEDPATRP